MSEAFLLQKFSLNNSSTKEKIIHLLAETPNIPTKEVAERLKKDYSVDVTYQAIHKLLQELDAENTVEKNNGGWKLKKEWLQKGSSFFQKAIDKHNGAINRYDIPENFEGTLTFEFDSFTDLCVKTAELLKSKKLAKDNDTHFLCVLEYGWWAFKFKFEHLQLLWDMMTETPNSKNIIRKDTPFGRWVREQYNKVRGTSAPIGTSIDIEEDLFIQGDHIIQVKISEEGKKIIEHYWSKWKNLEDSLKDFGLRDEPKIHSTIKITKNPQLAQFMRKELEKYFEQFKVN